MPLKDKLLDASLPVKFFELVPPAAEKPGAVEATLAELKMIRHLAEKAWTAARKELRIARTVVLKLKTSEFKILTRSHTPRAPPSSCEELTNIALSLRERINLSPKQRFRLVDVGLGNFYDPNDAAVQPALVDELLSDIEAQRSIAFLHCPSRRNAAPSRPLLLSRWDEKGRELRCSKPPDRKCTPRLQEQESDECRDTRLWLH